MSIKPTCNTNSQEHGKRCQHTLNGPLQAKLTFTDRKIFCEFGKSPTGRNSAVTSAIAQIPMAATAAQVAGLFPTALLGLRLLSDNGLGHMCNYIDMATLLHSA